MCVYIYICVCVLGGVLHYAVILSSWTKIIVRCFPILTIIHIHLQRGCGQVVASYSIQTIVYFIVCLIHHVVSPSSQFAYKPHKLYKHLAENPGMYIYR